MKETDCKEKGLSNCEFEQGILTSSKFGFVYSALQVPMRVFQIYITTGTSSKEEMKLNDNPTVKFAGWVDTIFHGLMGIWFAYLTLTRGLSNFLGGSESTYFDWFAIAATMLQFTGDVSYLLYLDKTLNII